MTAQSPQLDPSLVAGLLDHLAKMVPAEQDDSEAGHARRREAARMLFEAMQPRDALEAALAARAVAAHYAAMDSYARAARPGTSDENAIRLRNSANAGSRSFDTALRTLEKRRAPPPRPRAETPRDPRKGVPTQPAQAAADAPIRIPGWPEPTNGEHRRAAYLNTTALATTHRPEPAEHPSSAIAGFPPTFPLPSVSAARVAGSGPAGFKQLGEEAAPPAHAREAGAFSAGACSA